MSINRRTPPGVRELKLYFLIWMMALCARRTPPGVRELKQAHLHRSERLSESHPSRGA